MTIIDKSEDGMLGTRTRGGRMEGANESNELWWRSMYARLVYTYVFNQKHFTEVINSMNPKMNSFAKSAEGRHRDSLIN